ncbi:secreted coth spore-coat protein domain-containing protein [Phycomyces blakesleeanus NRRL 1555(-)]|uniref:Secreted coth spore-coat protein domain-containing protein n=1 Tax=Phycomyces blakesleeanus (strain ATCC 8743b / DSM 1359 / FGSC 10004 / NBRC 33097 / NRRL 1555) TaxID=763407 RepID=A0A162U674_PHYB8|nr:secreted coth spore-coat protein domain-containing protein [Phycomyces blakesleeanus NRRL 1555(-)]OAD73752.1 secreted coth spore-coat protein domain-containing protein [Phycomyces blakesleeanus NRRL 1555(-)]|eukprot:XP_018291792.1 secreted coth spore-coat protein domain-containing protein [Phycomyces blakesleeanus NRRL 1555(-)]
MRITFIVFALAVVVSASSTGDQITYSVVSLTGGKHSMSVVVDNVPYPLSQSPKVPILYTGTAPKAAKGYSYAINAGTNGTRVEPFSRKQTSESTPNETFGRQWNTFPLSKVEPILPPLPAINRVESPLHIDGEIPTIYLSGNQTALDNMHTNSMEDISVSFSHVLLNSPHDVQSFSDIEIGLSGHSSRLFEKVSYNLKLKKKAKNHLYGYRRLKLRALATDQSYIREIIGYDVMKSVGIASTEYSYVRVILNDKPLGLFGFLEAYQNPWIQNEFANGDINYKQGILYQGKYRTTESLLAGVISDLSYYPNITNYALGAYNIKANPANSIGDYRPLMEFTKFIKDAPTTTPDAVQIWQSNLDVESFLRCIALEILVGYSDGYLTMSNNYYLYYETKAKRYIYLPSDLDLIMGSGFVSTISMTTGNYSDFPGFHLRPLTNKLMQVPTFKARLEELIVKVTKELFNLKTLDKRIDDVVRMITEDVAWDQALPRMGKKFIPGSNSDSRVPKLTSPTIDAETQKDLYSKGSYSLSFKDAVNGPTGHIASPGVKEFIKWQSENTMNFWRNTTGKGV